MNCTLTARYALITPEETQDEVIEPALAAANAALAAEFDGDEDFRSYFIGVRAIIDSRLSEYTSHLYEEASDRVEAVLNEALEAHFDEFTVTQIEWYIQETEASLEDML